MGPEETKAHLSLAKECGVASVLYGWFSIVGLIGAFYHNGSVVIGVFSLMLLLSVGLWFERKGRLNKARRLDWDNKGNHSGL